MSRNRLLLIVGACAATPRALELIGHFRGAHLDTSVALTERAARFVSPALFAATTGREPFVAIDDVRVPHVSVNQSFDCLAVAPASADLLARTALGLADDLATTLFLAWTGPTILAPALNEVFSRHPAQVMHRKEHLERGAYFVDGGPSVTASGRTSATGFADLARIARSVQVLVSALAGEPLRGICVDVDAGLLETQAGGLSMRLARMFMTFGASVRACQGTEPEPDGNEWLRLQLVGGTDTASVRIADKEVRFSIPSQEAGGASRANTLFISPGNLLDDLSAVQEVRRFADTFRRTSPPEAGER